MDSKDMQVIGVCRFSYPALGGFQVEHETPEERMAFLYAPERMEERFRIFEAFTLPPLRAQTDPDFTFLVIIGDQMPAHYRTRLEKLLADIPQAIIAAYPPEPHRDIMKVAINAVRRESKHHCLQFRMDDDDAVNIRFVERLRERVNELHTLIRLNKHIAIDFSQGYIAAAGPDGIKSKPTMEHLWTAGLAMTVSPKSDITILNFGHSKMGKFMPVVSYAGEDMFIRGHNDYNDSRQKGAKPLNLPLLDAKDEAHFKRVFNIDADHVRALFS